MSIKKKKGEKVTLTETPVVDFDTVDTFIGTFVRSTEQGHVFLEDETKTEYLMPDSSVIDQSLVKLVNGKEAREQDFTWFITRTSEGFYKIDVE